MPSALPSRVWKISIRRASRGSESALCCCDCCATKPRACWQNPHNTAIVEKDRTRMLSVSWALPTGVVCNKNSRHDSAVCNEKWSAPQKVQTQNAWLIFLRHLDLDSSQYPSPSRASLRFSVVLVMFSRSPVACKHQASVPPPRWVRRSVAVVVVVVGGGGGVGRCHCCWW